MMHWPRGKYNGELIVGVSVKVVINVRSWFFRASWNFGAPYIHLGFIHIWCSPAYTRL